MTSKTIRGNGKWAKVSGQRGKWTLAKGWEGDFKAVRMSVWHTKDGAMIAAHYWLED